MPMNPSLEQLQSSPDNHAQALLTLFRFLNPKDVQNFMGLSHFFNDHLKESYYWRGETKRYFPNDYKKFLATPAVNWYEVFKRLYYLYYNDCPSRSIKLFSLVCSGDIAELKKFGLMIDDFYLRDNHENTLKSYIVRSQDQRLMKYFFKKVVQPYYKNEAGYDTSKKDSGAFTILHYLAQFNQPIDVEKMKPNALVMSRMGLGDCPHSPIHLAALHGHIGVIAALMDCGIPVDYADKFNITPLICAVRSGKLDVVQFLCGRGADTNAIGLDGLKAAALHGHYAIFMFLIARGSAPSLLRHWSDLLHFAVRGGSAEIFDYIVNAIHGIAVNAPIFSESRFLHIAAENGHAHIFMKLVQLKADLAGRDFFENTVLHVAMRGMNSDIVRYIINQDIRYVHMRNEFGETPLHVAAGIRYVFKFSHEIIDILLESGADVNATTFDPVINDKCPDDVGQETPLHSAVAAGDVVTVEKLLAYDADVNARASNGNTPIFGVKNSVRILGMLIEAGADVNAVNWNNETALVFCIRRDRYQYIEILVNKGAKLEKNSLVPMKRFDFSRVIISEYSLKMLLRAAPTVQELNLSGVNIILSHHSDDFYLAPNSLSVLRAVNIEGSQFSLLPLLKIILRASPNARLNIQNGNAEIMGFVLAIYQEVFEEVGYRSAGMILAGAYKKGYMGFPKNLAYAKEIYTSLGMKKKANKVQRKIDEANVSAIGLFSTPSTDEEKRPSEGYDSPSKRQRR